MKDAIIAEISFGPWKIDADEAWLESVDEAFHGYLTSLVRCGQIIGEPVRGVMQGVLNAFVRLPAHDSLEIVHSSRYGQKDLERLESLFGQKPVVTLLSSGDTEQSNPEWKDSPWLVLLSAETEGLGAIRTSDLECIPNYLLPLDAHDAEKLFFWANQLKQHSDIWYASGSLEVEALRALADPLSQLNREAARLARMVEKATNKPVYTTLFRHYALPGSMEAERPCPLCGKPWKVEGELFDFRCEPCRLVSEMGPSDAENGWEEIGTWSDRLQQTSNERWKPAEARTLLGMLQRGRGEGFQRLLDEAPQHAWALIEDCLRHDPRMDRQVESRSWYYGTLILKTEMPLERVWRVLSEVDEEETLVLGMVGWLAENGVSEAVDALVTQVKTRRDWCSAAAELKTSNLADTAEKLGLALTERFPEPAALADAIAEGWNLNFDSLRHHESALVRAAVMAQEQRENEQPQRRAEYGPEYAHLSLKELIEAAGGISGYHPLGKCAAEKATAEDVVWLLSQLSHEAHARTQVALMALRPIANEAMLEPLLAFFRQGIEIQMKRGVCIRLRDVFLELPAHLMLPLARQWIRSKSEECRTVARGIFARHAEVCDIPMMRKLLARSLRDEESNLYLICDLLEAFARFAGHGCIPEVAQAYTEMRYAYGRKLAVRAIHALSPEDFRTEYAQECLWDCEEDTRALAETMSS